LAGLLMTGAWLGLACGPLTDDLFKPGPGRTCYEDTDCVPAECCGTANSAVHKLDGPNCGAVQCTGSCPAAQVECGCGYPVCKDQRCTVAFQTGPGC
jgi:hypothetical protein